jgi:hypothetical protein
MLFYNCVYACITKTCVREIITVYPENLTRHINTLCGIGEDFLVLSGNGAHNYHHNYPLTLTEVRIISEMSETYCSGVSSSVLVGCTYTDQLWKQKHLILREWWKAAKLHTVYLHSCSVHTSTSAW